MLFRSSGQTDTDVISHLLGLLIEQKQPQQLIDIMVKSTQTEESDNTNSAILYFARYFSDIKHEFPNELALQILFATLLSARNFSLINRNSRYRKPLTTRVSAALFSRLANYHHIANYEEATQFDLSGSL